MELSFVPVPCNPNALSLSKDVLDACIENGIIKEIETDENSNDEEIEPDKVSDVMDHEISETENEQNENNQENLENDEEKTIKELQEVNIEVDDDVLDVVVLRMCMQPMIENAVFHGLKKKGGRLSIICKRTDTGITICIEDDGKGIEQKQKRRPTSQGRASLFRSQFVPYALLRTSASAITKSSSQSISIELILSITCSFGRRPKRLRCSI